MLPSETTAGTLRDSELSPMLCNQPPPPIERQPELLLSLWDMWHFPMEPVSFLFPPALFFFPSFANIVQPLPNKEGHCFHCYPVGKFFRWLENICWCHRTVCMGVSFFFSFCLRHAHILAVVWESSSLTCVPIPWHRHVTTLSPSPC